MSQRHHLAVGSTAGRNGILETLGHIHSSLASSRWPKEQEVNDETSASWWASGGALAREDGLLHGSLRRLGLVGFGSGVTTWSSHFFRLRKESLSFTRFILSSSKLILLFSFFESESLHQALYSFNVCNMKINFFLQNDKIFIHLDFQIMSSCFNLCLKLKHLFLLGI